MRSIRDIVQEINKVIEVTFRDAKTYGIARTAVRGEELLPTIDEQYIGIDDTYALQVYHKLSQITMGTRNGRAGYGDNTADPLNTYSMVMVVMSDEQRTKLMADQIALVIQSAIYNISYSTDFFRSVDVSIRSVILNSEQVYQQEYRSDSYRLSEKQSLMQINYSVEITWKPGCFAVCPEDFINCKN